MMRYIWDGKMTVMKAIALSLGFNVLLVVFVRCEIHLTRKGSNKLSNARGARSFTLMYFKCVGLAVDNHLRDFFLVK